jgi:hypothetical protein
MSKPPKVLHGARVGDQWSTTYRSWQNMKKRCRDPNGNRFDYYGGRGVRVCKRWRLYGVGFMNFLADMGERPPGTTLDRYPDKNGNYEPGNCRWATPEQQARNRRPRRRDE